MIKKQCKTYWVKIEVAGNYDVIRQTCREFCWEGCCVQITPVDYIYTGGEESGASIMIVNYPRFQKTNKEIWEQAERLALLVRGKACQWSVMLMAPDKTKWITFMEKRENG